MIEINFPESIDSKIKEDLNFSYPRVFLGGGITGAPDWQRDFVESFSDFTIPFYIFNPRREDFDIYIKETEKEQITWEFTNLRKAHLIVMWFPKEAQCMISLHELGFILGQFWAVECLSSNLNLEKNINRLSYKVIIGIEEGYVRESDILIQTELSGIQESVDKITFVKTLDELKQETRNWVSGK